jgi:tRNA pseudouridine55 synthase
VLFGEATKFGGGMLDADKAYDAELILGIRTSTGDAEGEVLESRPVAVTLADVEAAARRFRGWIEQVPPMYSALKRDGRPLYDYARAGESVARAPRRVRIDALDIVTLAQNRLRIRVRCSKGTYVRVLAEDLGEALGCGAHLALLRRTGVGPFALDDASTLDRLAELDPAGRAALLLPPDRLLDGLPRIELDPEGTRSFLHGQGVPAGTALAGAVHRVYDTSGRLLGVGEADAAGRILPKRLIAWAAAETL